MNLHFKNSFQVDTNDNPVIKKLLVALARKNNINLSFTNGNCEAVGYRFLQFWVRNGKIESITHNPTIYYGKNCGTKITKNNDISLESAVLLLTTGEVVYSPIKIQLNNNHTAEILENGDVQVGCQNFTSKVIIELAEAVKVRVNEYLK